MTSQNQRNFAVLAAVNHANCSGQNCIPVKNDPWIYAIYGTTILVMGGILIIVLVLMRKQRKLEEATSLSNLPWINTLEGFTMSAMNVSQPPPAPGFAIVISDLQEEGDGKTTMKSSATANATVTYINVEEAKETGDEPNEEGEGPPTYEAAVQREINNSNK